MLLIVLGLPLSASAQQHQRPAPPPPATMGSIGLPLPAIGLPMTVPYQKPWEWTVPAPAWERNQMPAWEKQGPPAWERGPRPSQPIQNPRDRRRPARPVYPTYGYPAYGIGYSYGAPYLMTPAVAPGATPPPAPPPVSDIGYLRLEVEPASLLQIYVDGVYVGTPGDHRGELELRAGARRIEIRAPGYEPMTFDVRVEAERGITYRGDLRPTGALPPSAAPAVLPTGSRTLYVIPGCYLGNVLPDRDRLPAGCDISRMKTHAPQ
ncbi:MAG: hypothetical protein Q8O42_17605 [Acidobacteriota bacterium]|nr:hypothetical protein [Acidobacteriota bacterium]